MFADHGVKTLAIDLDPQANLTAMFLDDEHLEALWPDDEHPDTIYGAIRPILRGLGDIALPKTQCITGNLELVAGDLGLSRFEDKLSNAWPNCHNQDEAAFRIMTAFYRLIVGSAHDETGLALIDVGPNLGAINRAALIASDQVVVPLAPDLFSLQGLKNLGPTLREWRRIWAELLHKAPPDLKLPKGTMTPVGYVVMQHGMRDARPGKAYQRWLNRIPMVYREAVLDESAGTALDVATDPYKLSLLKHYRSLMPLAMDANKPMFFLKTADGAIGAHQEAVRSCYADFEQLAARIAVHAGMAMQGTI
jgi:chromosome partitioning protein